MSPRTEVGKTSDKCSAASNSSAQTARMKSQPLQHPLLRPSLASSHIILLRLHLCSFDSANYLDACERPPVRSVFTELSSSLSRLLPLSSPLPRCWFGCRILALILPPVKPPGLLGLLITIRVLSATAERATLQKSLLRG